MFLRSLTLRGFKSFADKTTLEFGPSLSVIVGPNGSGKSNLVDAIAWVLGEQGPRALRGAQMADVVFAGSPARPALGMAQVSLVIDNSAGLLPVDATEIEIARVVYRSGESQYLIGGEPVRLLDIQELLSDTGVGRALHTVVGQGQLEDALVARPEERRVLIEEAAGIAKHRRRRDRSERKLAGLDQDLLRLQDVMTEVKRQLRPLKQQAEAAGKYEALQAEADEVAWRLAAARIRSLWEQRDGRRAGWETGMAERRAAEERLAALDRELAALAERLSEAERRLEEAEHRESETAGARSAAEAALREAVRVEGEARARLAAEANRTGRLFTLEEETRRAEADLEATSAALAEKEAELAEAERSYAEAERARREAEETRRHARDVAVARRAEAQTLRRSLELATAERDRLTALLEDVRLRDRAMRTERDRLETEVERMDAEEAPYAARDAELERELERLDAELADLVDRERRLTVRKEGLEARRDALEETPGKRFLEGASRAIGLFSELIEVDEGLEAAVAAALGPLADAVVYEDRSAAVAEAGGGATIAVSDRAAGGFVLPGERSLLSVVRADPRARAAVTAALRHVYLAKDRDDALAKHRRHPAAAFVTLDGVLVGPALVRSAPATAEDALAVRRDLSGLDRDLARLRVNAASRRQALERLAAERSEIAEALRRADGLITATAERMGHLDADLAALEREASMLADRLAAVEETLRSLTATLETNPADAGDLPDVPRAAEPPLALRVEVESLRRERRRLERTLEGRREDAARLRADDPETLRAALDRAALEREAAEGALGGAESAAREAAVAREEAARAAAESRRADADANRAWRDAASELQRLRDTYEDEEQARRDLERRIAEAERAVAEGHRRDPADAVAALADDETVDELSRRADLLARRLQLLGRVNLVAADEYRALQERHDFLKREIDDVQQARRDLQQVIRDVDRKIVEIFDTAFGDVAAEFERIFAELFPEGSGKLVLTAPDDLLATGVEIEARPGRKRVKRLSLLSGGERALTALAFLFAIFRARPSPFYLLDEVEAALDDVNLHRFIRLVKGFAETSQVIVVTHQKRTMESADVLYGVSMGRDGSSSVISQRVSDAVAADTVGADAT